MRARPTAKLRAMSSAGPSTHARVALVTGASSGIGEACARSLAAAGFRVALAARRGELLEGIAKDISRAGGDALPVAVDLAEADGTSDLLRRTIRHWGRIDVLVNNAGYSPPGAMEQVSRDGLRHAFEVNLFSGLQLVAEVAPIMRAQGGGRIVNMGSMAGTVAAPLAVPYSATKAGLDAATRGLRLELGRFGIHVSLVVPGFVDTAVFENSKTAAEPFRADPENPYRQTFFEMEAFAGPNFEKAIPASAVGDLVARVATAKRPRPRYYAPASARLQGKFMTLLPARVADSILRRVYKLPS